MVLLARETSLLTFRKEDDHSPQLLYQNLCLFIESLLPIKISNRWKVRGKMSTYLNHLFYQSLGAPTLSNMFLYHFHQHLFLYPQILHNLLFNKRFELLTKNRLIHELPFDLPFP